MQIRRLTRNAPLIAVVLLGVTACSSADATGRADRSSGAVHRTRRSCDTGAGVGKPLLAPTTETGGQSASYSNEARAPQAKSCAGMRTYLATPQPGFNLQSYVFYGHLKDSSSRVIPFSTLMQLQQAATGVGPADIHASAVTVNTGDGITVGTVAGVADSSIAVSATSNPFSLRSQIPSADPSPQYIEARVVEGQLGQPGAIIEITAQVMGQVMADPKAPPTPMQVSVRLKDVAGVGQWGYGPSGFFPQWIFPEQRKAITDRYHGSVGDYLKATNDPMTDQGSYYYSSPVVEVLAFTITVGGSVLTSGTDGEILIDYVNQTFDPRAGAIVQNGVQWTEFSTLLDDGRTMKVGKVSQSSVGLLPYAMMQATNGPRHRNGALKNSMAWDMDHVTLAPDSTSSWTSPRSGKTYATKYTAQLKGRDGKVNGSLTYRVVYDDQELDVDSRTVYEGLYRVTGTIDGSKVRGYAWAEIQPSGTL